MSRLNSWEIDSFKNSCYNGAKVEWIYQSSSGSGKVSGSGFMDGVKVSGVL